MDLGTGVWLLLAFVLPLLAVAMVFLLRQRVKLSKNVSWFVFIVAIALLTIYWIWSLFFR